MASLTVPKEFAAVGAVLSGVPLLFLYLDIRVSSARKAAKVPYPIMYVDPEQESKDRSPQAARVFNCAQRAHYNTIEQLAAFLPALLVSGVRFPLVSAGLGATWLVGRVGYTEGYLSGDPKKRNSNIVALPGTLAVGVLMFTSVYAAGEAVFKAFF